MKFTHISKQIETSEILNIITTYKHILYSQLCSLYPEREDIIHKIIKRLIELGRIKYDEESDIITTYFNNTPVDTEMIKALWILVTFSGKRSIEQHLPGDKPIKIYFYMQGSYYEIIYVKHGYEEIIHNNINIIDDPAIKIILVDNYKEQGEFINIPNTQGFCTVSDNGKVNFYKNTKEL